VKNANPLDSKFGRMLTFFLLYVSEGLPNGFIVTAMVFYLREEGLGTRQIGAFTAAVLLPWSWKWAMGPVVDVFYSTKWGRRRAWIVGAQLMMLVTLMSAMGVDLSSLWLLTGLLLVHNIFAATQDVAIDALACNTLREDERGLANGLMFGGAHTGYVVGGAGSLYLMGAIDWLHADLMARGTATATWLAGFINFNLTFLFIGACMLTITLFVSMRLREPAEEERQTDTEGSPLARAFGEVGHYLRTAVRSMFANRPAFVGKIIALAPIGAVALARTLRMSLASDFGLKDQIANIEAVVGIIWIAGCMIGGFLSDIFGRRKMMAIYVAMTALPTLYLVMVMTQHGWTMPVDPELSAELRPKAPAELVTAFWGALMVYNLLCGLVFGTQTALFMDVTNPAVAATQFTAYMALMNFTGSYSDLWQGYAAERFGYPITLSIDAGLGMICILLLPLTLKSLRKSEDSS